MKMFAYFLLRQEHVENNNFNKQISISVSQKFIFNHFQSFEAEYCTNTTSQTTQNNSVTSGRNILNQKSERQHDKEFITVKSKSIREMETNSNVIAEQRLVSNCIATCDFLAVRIPWAFFTPHDCSHGTIRT